MVSNYAAKPINELFSLSASTQTVDTNGQVQLKALYASGTAAAVHWTLTRGENDGAIGQGTIDARGVYTPPASLTRDGIDVEIQAQLRSDPTKTATEVIHVNPGFLQPLTPENSALPPGGSLPVSAQLAEVGGGDLDWRLSTAASGGRRLDASFGSFSQESCQHSAQNYTVCSAIYTAPPSLPAGKEVYVVATVHNTDGTAGSRQSVHVLLSNSGISSSPLTNQSAQTSLVQLGSSGGNNNDADASQDRSGGSFINDCCGGTLGALVRDQTGSQYILSNNHVLAESDQANQGDSIVQPGLIDANCDQNAGRPVASLRYVVPLASSQTNVDAALAEVNAGSVDPGGAILQFGTPGKGTNNSIDAAPPAGGAGEAITPALLDPGSAPLRVAKSGRTTGLTCSTIEAVNLSLEVDYYKDCAETQPYYRKTFVHQIGIGGNGFSDSGDSGALVVDAGNAEPLGLYFAGGTDDHGGGFSVVNPIQDVLSELGAHADRQFSIVGGAEHPISCLNYDGHPVEEQPVPELSQKKAQFAARKNASTLVNPATGILDLASGASADSPGSAALIVYVDKAREGVQVPAVLNGFRTVVVPADPASVADGTAPKIPSLSPGIQLSAAALQEASTVQQAYAKHLMVDPAIFGVGVTQSRDNPAEAALLVLVDISRTPRAMPAIIGGLRTRYVFLHRFHVTRSKYAGAPHLSSCSLKSSSSKTVEFRPEQLPALDLH
ncbi:hypothetical protein ACPOL_1783 [Acidisarcina polymorpha]|uniref:Uncharacterized protein n=1 Tax=Acidisarcina polymorpha TaxID=2211140 RepID=A0A2Z5FXL7_9BACT|nr:hypothetical protein ACPOL_1783 [Acidisarcina polymorpha]